MNCQPLFSLKKKINVLSAVVVINALMVKRIVEYFLEERAVKVST